MKTRHLIGATSVIVMLAAEPARAGVLAPGDTIGGRSQLYWAEQFWAWAIPISPSVNPLLDTTGAQGFRGDVGPVFFLAGTASDSAVTRHVVVPEGKTLFFPIINAFSDNTPLIGDPPTTFTAAELLSFTTPAFEPGVVTLFATLDGTPIADLTSHRQTTNPADPFSYTVSSADNLLNGFFGFDASLGTGVYPATVSPVVQDGYYLAIAGLTPGQHTLTFGGVNGNGSPQDITYDLVITAVPEPTSLSLAGIGGLVVAGYAWRRRRGVAGA